MSTELENANFGEKPCFRHPKIETLRSCSRCDRPACPKCLRDAPVGSHCVECIASAAKASPRARAGASLSSKGGGLVITPALLVLNTLVFFLTVSKKLSLDTIALFVGEAGNFGVANGEWYRLITSGFGHINVLHFGMNMLSLYNLGTFLEPVMKKWQFLGAYMAALFMGSAACVIFTPSAATVGASGAIFGLLGIGVFALRRRGVKIMQSPLGKALMINLAITFMFPEISKAGHLGGLAAGAAYGWFVMGKGRATEKLAAPLIGALTLISVGAGVYFSYNPIL